MSRFGGTSLKTGPEKLSPPLRCGSSWLIVRKKNFKKLPLSSFHFSQIIFSNPRNINHGIISNQHSGISVLDQFLSLCVCYHSNRNSQPQIALDTCESRLCMTHSEFQVDFWGFFLVLLLYNALMLRYSTVKCVSNLKKCNVLIHYRQYIYSLRPSAWGLHQGHHKTDFKQ